MGIWNLDNPGRAGFEAAPYDGWPMSNIIRDFTTNHDLATERDRVWLRKALLVSSEVRLIQEGGRINV